MTTKTATDFTALTEQAHLAGLAAAVGHHDLVASGYAAVHLTPGTSALARWLVATGLGRPAGREHGGGPVPSMESPEQVS